MRPRGSRVALLGLALTLGLAEAAGAAPVITTAIAYPNPAVAPEDPRIRVCPGIVDSIEVTIFNAAGETVVSSSQFDALGVAVTGVGAGQYCYEYLWGGRKATGAYYAVVHVRGGGVSASTRIKLAVVR